MTEKKSKAMLNSAHIPPSLYSFLHLCETLWTTSPSSSRSDDNLHKKRSEGGKDGNDHSAVPQLKPTASISDKITAKIKTHLNQLTLQALRVWHLPLKLKIITFAVKLFSVI